MDREIGVVKNAFDSARWIGVGNSLIKSEGIEAISRIKEEFLDKKIVADMMVRDNPAEVEEASRAGADIITVSGMSDEGTLLACVNAGRINGTEIIADLRNMSSVKDRAEILEKLGVNYFLLDFDNMGDICDFVQIPIIAACPIDNNAIVDAIESGADIISLKLNNEDDLRRFIRVGELIHDESSILHQDIRTMSVFEKITKELGSIKRVIADIELQRRKVAEDRKRLDNEIEGLEEQRKEIAEEMRKLKDVEINLENEYKRKEEAWRKLEEERRGKWIEHEKKKETEIKKIEDEWGKIKKTEKTLENKQQKIANEMRQIEQEWMKIEEMKSEIEKRLNDVEEKIEGSEVKIIAKENATDMDDYPMDIEIKDIRKHTERNIEDDLLKIKEEHKKRK